MWTNIPKYDDGNNVINYSVKMMYSDSEDDEYTPAGYIRTVSPLTEGYIFNLMSQHTPERINVTVNKLWRDNLKSYETREQTPEDIGITLKADGVEIEPESIDTASNARRWVYVWKDLPVYKDGVEINYTVDEATVPTGYSKSISYEADSEGDVEYTITNTLDGWEKTIIDAVEVNLPYPTSGQTLSQVAPTIIGSNYKIKSYKWLRRGSAVADDTVFEDGTFRPDIAVTRAEFAVIASKFDRLTDSDENVFTDIEDNFWAKPYILLAYKRGWVDGYEDGTFRPYNAITRAEVVSITNRMLERNCDKEYLENNPDEIKTYKDVTDEHWAYYDIEEASNAHLYVKNPDEVWTEIVKN